MNWGAHKPNNEGKHMKRLLLTALFTALILPAHIAAAQDNAQKAAITQMDDMVVTATRTAEPIKDIPGRVAVITREQIKEMPVQTVDEALSYISGVHQERQNGPTSFKTIVSLRGVGNDQGRTLVLLDGVPLNTADMGDVNWNRLNLEDVERIEVLKGPAAAVYGSSAMGGVINVISVKPTKRFEGSTSASFGTNEDWQLRGVAAARSSEDPTGFYARVSGLYHYNRGYNNTPSDQRTQYSTRTYLDQKTINTKLGWDLTETNTLEFQYTRDDQREGEGTKIRTDNGTSRGYGTNAWQMRFKGAHEGWSTMLNAYYIDTHYDRATEKMTNSYSLTEANVERQNYGLMTSLSRAWGPNTFTVGFDYSNGGMDGGDIQRTGGRYYYDNYGYIRNLAGFAQDQIRLFDDKLIVLVGLRYDNATTYSGGYQTNDPSMRAYNASYSDHTWDAWSPRASVKYFFMDNLSAYASYGRAFRAPMLDSMYRSGSLKAGKVQLANPDLDPETIDSFEIGVDYQPLDNLKLSASGYHSIAHDFLYRVNVTPKLLQTQNVGEVSIWGAEFNVEYEPFKYYDNELFKRFSLFGNYTHNDSRISKFSKNKSLEGKLLTNTPQDSFNLGFNWLNRYLNSRVAVQYNGMMYTDDTNSNATIDPHALFNAKIWRNLDFLGKYGENFKVSFSVDNIFDYRYLVTRNSDTENVGRTMYLELSCKF